ncbi:MAG: hypothetical protein WBO18_16555 [Gammaproteobacteria bacterium]
MINRSHQRLTTNLSTLLVMNHFPRRVLICFLLSVPLHPFKLSAAGQYEQIVTQDQRVTIYYQDAFNEAERKMTRQWLHAVIDALRTVYHVLPMDHFQITLKRSSSLSGPVPWGHVERGDPTNIVLVINPELGYDALISDWTAFHEFSHLLLPYRGYGDIWLSEGLATYYQNIIQARSGLFDDSEMWHKIVAGFKRGQKQQGWRHVNLTEVSDNLGETRQYMRVHWSGVLFWLTADVELRKKGNSSLDDALKQLRLCCEGRPMSAEAIVSKLDQVTNETLFVPLFKKYRASHSIPDYESILTDLGVGQEESTGAISLDDDAPLADIRRDTVRANKFEID